MSTSPNFINRFASVIEESKSERIAELLKSGKLSKAEIAKAVGANYSQVHSKAKQLIAAGIIGEPPTGKKGRTASGSASPIKRTPVARVPAKKAIVAKPVVTARPAGVAAAPSAAEKNIDQMIIHMLSVIDEPTYADLVTAATESINPAEHDMSSDDVANLVRSRIKSLVSRGEIFQSPKGIFSATPPSDEEEEEIADDDLSAFKVDDDDDDGDSDFMKSYFDSGRRTGGYHL